jgi:hypothetical protein
VGKLELEVVQELVYEDFALFDCFGMFDRFTLVVCLICTVYILGGSPCGAPPVAVPRFSWCLQAQAHTWIAALRP